MTPRAPVATWPRTSSRCSATTEATSRSSWSIRPAACWRPRARSGSIPRTSRSSTRAPPWARGERARSGAPSSWAGLACSWCIPWRSAGGGGRTIGFFVERPDLRELEEILATVAERSSASVLVARRRGPCRDPAGACGRASRACRPFRARFRRRTLSRGPCGRPTFPGLGEVVYGVRRLKSGGFVAATVPAAAAYRSLDESRNRLLSFGLARPRRRAAREPARGPRHRAADPSPVGGRAAHERGRHGRDPAGAGAGRARGADALLQRDVGAGAGRSRERSRRWRSPTGSRACTTGATSRTCWCARCGGPSGRRPRSRWR